MNLVSKIDAICNSLSETFRKLNQFFEKLIDMGFGMKKIIAMTVNMFATILTNVIEQKVHKFDMYVNRITNKGLSIGMDIVKSIPFAGASVAIGNAGLTAIDTTDDIVNDVANNMDRIDKSLDKELSNVGNLNKRDMKKKLFRKRISQDINPKPQSKNGGGKKWSRKNKKKQINRQTRFCKKKKNN
jgi:hypothetical protein